MDSTTDPSLQDIPISLRNLQSPSFVVNPLTSPLGTSDFNPANSFSTYNLNDVQPAVNGQANAFPQRSTFQTPVRYPDGRFNVLSASTASPFAPDTASPGAKDTPSGSRFSGLKAIPDPPNLDIWRERLFNVNELITLSEEEFQTYFPHVDNIYSHRSTQKHKSKPFLSHYWDCRLKGRPPGTRKSEDPSKKKRRRVARERDLCDVKIKIVEYFPSSEAALGRDDDAAVVNVGDGGESGGLGAHAEQQMRNKAQPFGVLAPSVTLPPGHPGEGGRKYYTLQRVNVVGKTDGEGNENGDGNREGAGGGGHRHSLEESDRIKKNSVLRGLLKEEKEGKRKKVETTPNPLPRTTQNLSTSVPSERRVAILPKTNSSGAAANTISQHLAPSDLVIYGGASCPMTQMIWIALELKGLAYQFVETFGDSEADFPRSLIEKNPSRKLPCLVHEGNAIWDSVVAIEYLEELHPNPPLLPPPGEPLKRAHCRMWANHVTNVLLPGYEKLVTKGWQMADRNASESLKMAIKQLVQAADTTGPFFLGPNLSLVDLLVAPCFTIYLHLRGFSPSWPEPEGKARWWEWKAAIEADKAIGKTVNRKEAWFDLHKRKHRHGV